MVGRIVYLMGHQEKYPQTKFIIGSSALKTEADEGKGGDESEEQGGRSGDSQGHG